MSASQTKKLSSEIGPAVMPSGPFNVSSRTNESLHTQTFVFGHEALDGSETSESSHAALLGLKITKMS